MSEEKSKSRRKVLKSLVVAGGATGAIKALPGDWKKPIVSAVSLPAHANTSLGSLTTCFRPLGGGTYGGGSYTIPVGAGGAITHGPFNNVNFNVTGTFTNPGWSMSGSGSARNGTGFRSCNDGNCSTINWTWSGSVGGSGSSDFRRYCNGLQVSQGGYGSITSEYGGGNLTIHTSGGTFSYCPDLFDYSVEGDCPGPYGD